MASLKRKHEDVDDSEEEEPAYGKQILPVANLPNDFNGEPMDGMQYLFTVRRDAKQRPGVVCVPNPYEQPQSSGNEPPDDGEEAMDIEGAPRLPSEEWRELFVYRFLNFRKNLDQPTIHVGPPTDGSRRLMPEKKDRDMWWAFLEGHHESEWTPLPKPIKSQRPQQQDHRGMRAWADEPEVQSASMSLHDTQVNDEGEVEQVLRVDPAESLPSPVGTPIPLEYLESTMQSGPSSSSKNDPAVRRRREPTTILLKRIDERTALHLLMYFNHWFNLYLKAPDSDDHIPRESHARWIFALLSRVDDQVFADDMNLLRTLARACIALIRETASDASSASTSANRMSESSCWLVVTLVADVWKQRDLWVDAEAILKSNK